MNELMTPQEAAERLGVTRAALYQAINEGRLPCVRMLNRLALREEDVAAYQPRAYRDRRAVENEPAEPAPKRPRGRPRKEVAE